MKLVQQILVQIYNVEFSRNPLDVTVDKTWGQTRPLYYALILPERTVPGLVPNRGIHSCAPL
jgi:hypothetical protein